MALPFKGSGKWGGSPGFASKAPLKTNARIWWFQTWFFKFVCWHFAFYNVASMCTPHCAPQYLQAMAKITWNHVPVFEGLAATLTARSSMVSTQCVFVGWRKLSLLSGDSMRTCWGWGDLWLGFRLYERKMSPHKEGQIAAFLLHVLNGALTSVLNLIPFPIFWLPSVQSDPCFCSLWLNTFVKLSIFCPYPFIHLALRNFESICSSGFLVSVPNLNFLQISLVILLLCQEITTSCLLLSYSPFTRNAMVKNIKHFMSSGVVTSNRHLLM